MSCILALNCFYDSDKCCLYVYYRPIVNTSILYMSTYYIEINILGRCKTKLKITHPHYTSILTQILIIHNTYYTILPSDILDISIN